MMRFIWFTIINWILVSACTANFSDNPIVEEMIHWLRSKDHSYYNDKIEIRRADRDNPNSYFGIFTNQKLKDKELIFQVPEECLISVKYNGEDFYHKDLCDLAEVLQNEIELGNESAYAPYVNYVQSQKPQIPSAWSEQGKTLLAKLLLDDNFDGKSTFPPINATNYGGSNCDSGDRTHNALNIILQRGWDTVLCPVYDMINHNRTANTISTSVRGKQGFTVHATRDIEAGEQLFLNYHVCADCDETDKQWGTPEVFRDFGFVEDYPQLWHLNHHNGDPQISFRVRQNKSESSDSTLQVEFVFGRGPNVENIMYLEETEVFLEEAIEDIIEPAKEDNNIPTNELDLIIQYHGSFLKAVSAALKVAKGSVGSCGMEFCPDEDIEDIGNGDYNEIYQCETLMHLTDYYNESETITSFHGDIEFYRDVVTKDTCLIIDDIYQVCGCYWPHYYEMAVHKTMKYVGGSIKRVLVVGGGDSGHLNEILKYPSVELVVGLEINQDVTRFSFKHFGAEPHYDNEKVQWWYGDVSKSLPMLPREYFGSFDLVLVDMPKTFFSLEVTKELDVIGALSLLLRKGGIFGMNALVFDKVSAAFQYTIHYTFQDVPKICDQSLIMASNDVDFLHQELKDHGVKNLLVETSKYKSGHRFDRVHDYRKNNKSTSTRLCKSCNNSNDPNKQKSVSGILMFVEVEDISIEEQPMEKLIDPVVESIKSTGLNVLSSSLLDDDELVGGAGVIFLQEGYITVHYWPEEEYCGFDIYLWSSFDRHEVAKRAVIKSVGGEISLASSYRLVVGGMFGVSTWNGDLKNLGPEIVQCCNHSRISSAKPINKEESNNPDVMLEEGLSLLHRDKLVVAVICGLETELCGSIDMIKLNDKVHQVIPIYTCAEILSSEVFYDQVEAVSEKCSDETLKILENSLSPFGEYWTTLKPVLGGVLGWMLNKKIEVIVVDKSASRAAGEIAEHIFHEKNRHLVSEDLMVMGTIEGREEIWKRGFVNDFRTDFIKVDPIFSAQLILREIQEEIVITVAGNTHFMQNLTDFVFRVENRTGLTLEVQNVAGGLWRSEPKKIMKDTEPSHFFLPHDLSHPSIERWSSQQPLGYQTVFQLEQGDTFEVGERVLGNFDGQWQLAEVTAVNKYNSYDIEYFDEDEDESSVKAQSIRKLVRKDDKLTILSSSAIDDIVSHTLSSMENEDMSDAITSVVSDVGDGYCVAAIWSGGTAIVLWDGRTHIDVNLFTYIADEEAAANVANEFLGHFTKYRAELTLVGRDEQPRGTGRIVNFLEDIEGTSPSEDSDFLEPPWLDNQEKS